MTHTPFPTPTAITPTPEQRPGIGEILLTDNFTSNSGWNSSTSLSGSVSVGGGEITFALSEPKTYLSSIRDQPLFDDYYLEITANPSLCKADDEYGLLLRVSPNHDYYRFSLSCDGRARVDRLVNNEASSPQPWVTSGAIPLGGPSLSVLAVWAVGEEFRFFVNDEYLFTIRDPILTSGGLGLFARSNGDRVVTVNFKDLIVREVDK